MKLTDELDTLLNNVGNEIDKERIRNRTKISSKSQLDNWAPETPGIYWIETNMPESDLLYSIKVTTGKNDALPLIL